MRIKVSSQLGQIVCKTLSGKYSTQKSAGGVVQVVELLSCKCEPQYQKERERERERERLIAMIIKGEET
jgi:hypothetical protein